jgi:hypothetical protein
MDAVTLIGLVAVAAMFCTGVALVAIGLRRRPDRLPQGADAVLDAVAAGRLVHPRRSAPKPETTPRVVDLVRPPTEAPRARHEVPAVKLVPRPEADLEPAGAPAPNPASSAGPDDTRQQSTAELNAALFDDVDDPSDGFFADKPALQRF